MKSEFTFRRSRLPTFARTETLLRVLLCDFKMARRSRVGIGSAVCIEFCIREETPTADQEILRQIWRSLKAMQIFPLYEDRDQ